MQTGLKSTLQPDAKGFDFGDGPQKFDDPMEERKHVKEQLACAYRVFAKLGLVEGAAGHLTVRDPVRKDCFWVTPFGKQFALMTASDLLLIDHDGEIVEGGRGTKRKVYNTAAFVIHAAIHRARPNANAVCHSHTTYGKAFSCLRRPLPMYTQDACVFYNDHAIYDTFGGVVLDAAESIRICESLGDKKAVILCNHGLLTVGETIESAVAWFIALENECKNVMLVEASLGGKRAEEIGLEEAQFTYDASGYELAGWFEALPWFELIEEETQGSYKA